MTRPDRRRPVFRPALRPLCCALLAIAGGLVPPAHAAGVKESDIAAMTTAPPPAAQTLLFVTITVNGDADSASLTRVQRDAQGAFSFERTGLVPLRFDMSKVPPGDWVPASALGPAQVTFKASDQTMALSVPPTLLTGSTLSGSRTAAARVSPSTWGGLFNYQVYASNDQTGKSGVYSLFGETRLLTPEGVASNTGLYTDTQGRQTFMRYDTEWHNAWPDTMITTTVGDLTTGGLTWTTPVRMGGFQISKSFTLRPDLITFPIPSFSGTAAATSSVDLYVNNTKQYSGDVVSGPFTLNTVPNVTGAATADVVVHDALGRDTVQHLTFYVEPRLLAKGLDDYSVEVGFLRRYYGVEQADYDRVPAVSAVYRKGLSDTFTLEGHLEGGGAYHANAVGVGGLWEMPWQMGVINLSTLGNVGQGGAQMTLGYSNLHQRAGVFGSVSRTFGAYHDLGSEPGFPNTPLQWQAGVSFPLGRTGSVGLNVVGNESTPGLDDSRHQTVGVTYSVQPTSSLNVFLSASRDLGSIKSTSLLLGLSYSFANGVSLSSEVSRSSQDKQVNVDFAAQQSPPYDQGFGWRVTGNNAPASGSVTGMYRNAYIDSSLGVGVEDKTTSGQLNLSGSVLWMDHDVLPGRNVTNGFALVATGYPDVPVEREHRLVGVTNQDGHLLVNDLNPYQNTTISIDPRQLPAGVEASTLTQQVSPKADAGALVRFQVKPIYGALITLNGSDGKPLPLGSAVQLDAENSQPQVVGYDGAVFMTGLGPHNTLKVTLKDGTCTIRFDYQGSPGKLPHLGPFVCTPGS